MSLEKLNCQIDYLDSLIGNHELQDEFRAWMMDIKQSLLDHQKQLIGVGTEEYKQWMGEYFNFFRGISDGIEPKITGVQGKALKRIITFLNRQGNEEGEGFYTWQFILGNWDKLSKFIQSQTGLSQIEKNLNEILTQIKKGHHDKQAKRDADSSELDKLDASLNALIEGKHSGDSQ